MKKTVYVAVVALTLLGLTGCGPTMHKTRVQSPTPPQSVVSRSTVQDDATSQSSSMVESNTLCASTLSVEAVDARIAQYTDKLDRWREQDQKAAVQEMDQQQTQLMIGCFRKLQKVLNGYTGLRSTLMQGGVTAGLSNDLANAIQQADISFLESECWVMLADPVDGVVDLNKNKVSSDVAEIEAVIARYSVQKEYENVLQTWSGLTEEQRKGLRVETKVLYGQALTYLHQEDKAITVYMDLVNDTLSSSPKTDILSLRKKVADLYTATGNYSAAERQYNSISSDYGNLASFNDWALLQLSILSRRGTNAAELRAYSDLLRDYLSFLPAQDGYKVVWEAEKFLEAYSFSPVATNVNGIKDEIRGAADAWYAGVWQTVDRLTADNQYEDALLYLQTIPIDLLGPERAATLSAKKEELLLASAVNRETTKMVQIQELQATWNNGLLLVKGERYDEAIAVFTELLDTEYGDKAKSKIHEVVLTVAQAERRKAADAFIQSTKTSNVESKKKLLVQSRAILKDILVKYPDVDIAEKVMKNIQRVELEMNTVDPQLLPRLRTQEMANKLGGGGSSQPDSFDVFNQPTFPQ